MTRPLNQKGWHMVLEEARPEEEAQQVLEQSQMPLPHQMQLQTNLGSQERHMTVHRTRKNVHFERAEWVTLGSHKIHPSQPIKKVLT